MTRAIGWTDQLIALLDQGLRTVAADTRPTRPSPSADMPEPELSRGQLQQSISLMRVNRAGEISAQALYMGQALFARSDRTRSHLRRAAAEEVDHLAWCTERIKALGGRGSLLDPVWYLGSAAIGAAAGLGGDANSLGFIAETEAQVEAHIEDHLSRLPETDTKSRAILEQMAKDEARHGAEARDAGAQTLSPVVRRLMSCGGEILRRFAVYL